jgi:hypothetical protein
MAEVTNEFSNSFDSDHERLEHPLFRGPRHHPYIKFFSPWAIDSDGWLFID